MAGLTVDDVKRGERLRAVTDNFFFWQGLRFAPIGVAMIVLAFVTAREDLDERVANGLLIATVAAAVVAIRIIGKTYHRDYGAVRGIPGAHSRRSRFKWLLVYPIMFAAVIADLAIETLPVMLSGVTWAIGLVLYRASTGGERNHYLVLAAALAALSLGPLAIAVTAKQMVTVMLLVLGAGYTVAALLDDKELRELMPGAPTA